MTNKEDELKKDERFVSENSLWILDVLKIIYDKESKIQRDGHETLDELAKFTAVLVSHSLEKILNNSATKEQVLEWFIIRFGTHLDRIEYLKEGR
jgi:hypothetical protein